MISFRKLIEEVADAYGDGTSAIGTILADDGTIPAGAEREVGDGLALFILVELRETMIAPGARGAEVPLSAADLQGGIEAMEAAQRDLAGVIERLRALRDEAIKAEELRERFRRSA